MLACIWRALILAHESENIIRAEREELKLLPVQEKHFNSWGMWRWVFFALMLNKRWKQLPGAAQTPRKTPVAPVFVSNLNKVVISICHALNSCISFIPNLMRSFPSQCCKRLPFIKDQLSGCTEDSGRFERPLWNWEDTSHQNRTIAAFNLTRQITFMNFSWKEQIVGVLRVKVPFSVTRC